MSLRVPGAIPHPVRVVIYLVTNAYTAPVPPGIPVGALVYEIWASACDATPLHEFPADMGLAIRYTDREAAGAEEGRFVIGRLDLASAAWIPVERRATDPAANVTSATITQTGYYMVWEAR